MFARYHSVVFGFWGLTVESSADSQEYPQCSPPRTPQLVSKSGRLSGEVQDSESRKYAQPETGLDVGAAKHNDMQGSEPSTAGTARPPPGFANPIGSKPKVVSSFLIYGLFAGSWISQHRILFCENRFEIFFAVMRLTLS